MQLCSSDDLSLSQQTLRVQIVLRQSSRVIHETFMCRQSHRTKDHTLINVVAQNNRHLSVTPLKTPRFRGKGRGKGSGVWPSMVTHTRNLCSAFNPSKCTHTRSSGQPMLRHLGSSWGFSALLKGLTSVVVLRVEKVLVIHSPHLQSLPDLRLEPTNFGLQIRLSNH